MALVIWLSSGVSRSHVSVMVTMSKPWSVIKSKIGDTLFLSARALIKQMVTSWPRFVGHTCRYKRLRHRRHRRYCGYMNTNVTAITDSAGVVTNARFAGVVGAAAAVVAGVALIIVGDAISFC